MIKNKYFKISSTILFATIIFLNTFNVSYAMNEHENQLASSKLVNINMLTGEVTEEEYPNNNTLNYANIENLNNILTNKTEPYFPDELLTSVSPNALVGDNDERSIVLNTLKSPYSAICYIETTYPDGSVGLGTAFMIYKNLALTAGHCVKDDEAGGVTTSIKVYPAKNGSSNPYGYTYVSEITIDANWLNGENPDEDWALLKLSSDIGNSTGWLGIAYSDDYSYFANGERVTVIGYPKPQLRDYRQYTMRDRVIRASAMRLVYAVDTEKGQSGSPVFDDPGYAIGIHVRWTTINGTVYNECSNITKARFNTFVSHMQ